MPRIQVVVARLEELRGVACRLEKHREPWRQLESLEPKELGRRVEVLGGRDIGAAWRELTLVQASNAIRETLSHGLVYRSRVADAPRRERLVDQMFAALDSERVRILANYEHDTETPVLGRATFERAFLLVDPRYIILLVREDED